MHNVGIDLNCSTDGIQFMDKLGPLLSAFDLEGLIDRLGHPRVLVLGDVILDRYEFGVVERISPEAPIPVIRTLPRFLLRPIPGVGANTCCPMADRLEYRAIGPRCAAAIGCLPGTPDHRPEDARL